MPKAGRARPKICTVQIRSYVDSGPMITYDGLAIGMRAVDEQMRVAGSATMQAEYAALQRAAENALTTRRASGEILTYELEGWVVQEHPGGRIECLAPVGQFQAEGSPYPGFTPPAR